MTRDQAIQALIRFDQPLDLIRDAVRSFPWDWAGPPLGVLTLGQIKAVTARLDLDARQLEEWANLIEGRDDVEFEDAAHAAIFRLANPDIH